LPSVSSNEVSNLAQSASQADATLEQAFLNARVTIGQWEARDGLTPSKPQGHFGAGREARAAWRVAPGPRHAALMERESAPAMTIRRDAVDVGPPGSSICAYPHSGNRYPLFRDMR